MSNKKTKLNKHQVEFLESVKAVENSNFIISITRGTGEGPVKIPIKKLKRD